MSPREALAHRIAHFIRQHNLDNPYGGDASKQGRYYSIPLSIPRMLDGAVRVYGPTFIQILLEGPLVHGERRGVYESEENAIAFLRALLVDHSPTTADAVPVRERR